MRSKFDEQLDRLNKEMMKMGFCNRGFNKKGC